MNINPITNYAGRLADVGYKVRNSLSDFVINHPGWEIKRPKFTDALASTLLSLVLVLGVVEGYQVFTDYRRRSCAEETLKPKTEQKPIGKETLEQAVE